MNATKIFFIVLVILINGSSSRLGTDMNRDSSTSHDVENIRFINNSSKPIWRWKYFQIYLYGIFA